MASLGALGSSRPVLTSQAQPRKAFSACGPRRSSCGAIGGKRGAPLCVKAIATPEKSTEDPFTAWGTAIERIPKRTDLKTIMILGAGPIVIGQVSCRPRAKQYYDGFHALGWALGRECNLMLGLTFMGLMLARYPSEFT